MAHGSGGSPNQEMAMMCLRAGAEIEERLGLLVTAVDQGRWPSSMGNVAHIAYFAGQMDACGADLGRGNVVQLLAEIMDGVGDEDEDRVYDAVEKLAPELGRSPPTLELDIARGEFTGGGGERSSR